MISTGADTLNRDSIEFILKTAKNFRSHQLRRGWIVAQLFAILKISLTYFTRK